VCIGDVREYCVGWINKLVVRIKTRRLKIKNETMDDNNTIVAKEILKQLKAEKLIADEEINLESKIANGTIREIDWRIVLEKQIINT